MVTTIQNGQMVKRSFVIEKKNKVSEAFLNILWDEGYILGYKNSHNKFKIFLKYENGVPVIKSFKIISKSSKKIYYSIKQIWKVNSNNIFIIISTSKGLKSIFDCKKENLGGEPLILIN
jgi:small subunit ribosomal protein S8